MANQQNETLIRRTLEMLNQPQLPTDYEQYYDPNFLNHTPIGFTGGSGGYQNVYSFWHEPFPDVHVTIEHLFSDGDFVAAQWHVQGTHTKPFLGTQPTGKKIDVGVTGIFRCRNGKVAEAWVTPDRLSLMQQLGIKQVPQAGQRQAA